MLEARPTLTGVLETVLYYTDQVRTEKFYTDILGMRLMGKEAGRSLFFRAGASVFLLFQADETLKGNTLPAHGAAGPIHTCFLVPEGEYERWKAYLAERGVPIISEVRWSSAVSFYFHDPDGNVLEIANGDLWPR